MGRIVDSLFKYVLLLIFGLLALRVAVSLVERILVAMLAPFTTSFFGELALALGLALMLLGLLIRGVRGLTRPRGRETRGHGVRERQHVRRPAVGVPLEGTRAPEPDHDPALPDEEG